jgi:hypothetical protein
MGTNYKEGMPLVKDEFSSERRKAKILNFSLAYGKTEYGLAQDFEVSRAEAKDILNRWYSSRPEVRSLRPPVLTCLACGVRDVSSSLCMHTGLCSDS